MKVGVKIGPKNWRGVLETTKPRYCEVWFRLDWEDRYQEMFEFLRHKKINFGLHFWAVLAEGYEPNLAYEPKGVAQESQELMQTCIDIASKVSASYVNIHPGALVLRTLDLSEEKPTVLTGQEVSLEESRRSLLSKTKELHTYAKHQGVPFYVETVAKNEGLHWRDDTGRQQVQDAKNIPPEVVLDLGKAGISITNDLAHTAASIITNDRTELFKHLLTFTQAAAPCTKLIHINSIAPPFNGTDSHHGILEEDFAQGVFPTKSQLTQLLGIFKDRDDVLLIPEPKAANMVANYFALRELCEFVS